MKYYLLMLSFHPLFCLLGLIISEKYPIPEITKFIAFFILLFFLIIYIAYIHTRDIRINGN